MIISSGFSFFKNLPLLLVLLLVLQRFGRHQWGCISELTQESHSVLLHPIDAGGVDGKDEVAVNFFPEDMIHSAWSLLGRATTVVGANMQKGDGRVAEGAPARVGVDDTKVCRGKNSDIRRTLEETVQGGVNLDENHRSSLGTATADLTTTARSKAQKAKADRWFQARRDYQKSHADIIRSHNLVLKVSWPETSRVEEWRVIERAQTLGEYDKFIKGHIPEVKCARDFGQYSTEHIRRFLGFPLDGSSGTRTLRLIVMNRLWPIYNLDGEQFWTAFWHCVTCMRSAQSLISL